MSGRRAPVWLADPTRYAGIARAPARLVLAFLALLLAGSLTAVLPQPRATEAAVVQDQTVAARVRGGESYYPATARVLRSEGAALKPFTTFALPTLTVIGGSLPAWSTDGLLWLLAVLTVLAWTVRLRPAFRPKAPLAIAAVLVTAGLAVAVRQGAEVRESWAGLFIALSLALRRPGRLLPSIALAVAAMSISAIAALYAVMMLAVALSNGDRREATGWAIALGLFALVMAAHAHAVGLVVEPLDPVSPVWFGMQGLGFNVRATTAATALGALPDWLAPMVWALGLFGWTAWRDPAAERTVLVLAAYAALLSLVAQPDDLHWALVAAPLPLIGLIFVPDGLRDLFSAALDRRRITVRRVAR